MREVVLFSTYLQDKQEKDGLKKNLAHLFWTCFRNFFVNFSAKIAINLQVKSEEQ